LQAKLLRAIQEEAIEKLGGNRQISLDIRLIAATNMDPLQAVKVGKMREDLYYRLNVFQLLAPPLRLRGTDISLLAQHFAAKKRCALNDGAKQILLNYAWPGNVRELENVLERASILASGGTITPQHLPLDMADVVEPTVQETFEQSGFSIPKATEQIERKLISEAITHCQGNKAKAAKMLEISERSLWYKLEQYHLK
jgi:two-component system, NtrC family, response regulator AtoC